MSDFFQHNVIIKNENSLPPGKVISAQGNEMEISEKLRKDILIWDISQNDKKAVWLLGLKTSYNGPNFMQVAKDIENKGYRIQKKAVIDAAVLSMLYDKKTNLDNQQAISTDSKVVTHFERIIEDALIANASDIHIEVRPAGGVVKMRKNGEVTEYKEDARMTFQEANNLCSVIYTVLANTKAVSFDPRDCQQGAVNYTIGEQELKLRYQSVPAYPDGYDVVLRVLPIGRSEDFTPLQKLGYTDQQVQELINISSRPVGSLIIAGVTGSGKSTTMKNLLMYINADTSFRLKIYTIEDPPEYNIARVTQIPVVIPKDFDPTKNSPFEKPIKACMRGDPDIIMIGEVRDKITGDLTKKAVQSGHQVLTTVHATSALGIIERFQDFGLSPSVLGSPDFLTGLLYQKLLGITCTTCRISFQDLIRQNKADEKQKELYKRIRAIISQEDWDSQPMFLRNNAGCKNCNFTGLKGRTVCAEVIMVDLNMQKLIMEQKTIEIMKYWRSLSDGKTNTENMRGKTCMEHGFQKMLKGLVCPMDVEASFKPINEMKLEKIEIEE